ncbi:MAG: hypothetical protein CMA63_01665 [Euryarchaeota archaeon]|nr:hypothetical protein [Euryarchaeota archaeon]
MNYVVEVQSGLDKWFLRQDVIDQLLASGEESDEAAMFGDRIMAIAEREEAEHQTLVDPFDRSVALVLSLVRDEGLDAWNIDLSNFLKVFTARVKSEASSLDLPACGRLIRLSWEVLHHQAEDLFDRIQYSGEDEDWGDDLGFGWEADYNDEDFYFTSSILQGEADELLPGLLENRVRRDEGRPVTLVELLSAFKDASDDAETLRLREENRIAHAEELKEYLSDVGGRMHNEDLEGDIKRCWQALRSTCLASSRSKVPVTEVMEQLKPILEHNFGQIPEGYDDEAKVASFIAGLFLTHRGFASITQDEVPDGTIFLEDSWPEIETFEEVKVLIESQISEENERIQSQETGSVRHAKLRAEKARVAEEASQRKQELALKRAFDLEQSMSEEVEVEVEVTKVQEQSYDDHEWLVE